MTQINSAIWGQAPSGEKDPITILIILVIMYKINIMARELRKPRPGALYHLIAKGNQGDYIFNENRNKAYFLECLGKGAEKFEAIVYAYCIMGNHYHIMLQNIEPNLSELMHYIGSSFATYLRSQGRIGHIFSGRYKSIYLDKGERVLYLSKYLHLNPVRAGMVNRLEEYGWSSYRFFTWDLEPPKWLYTGWLKQKYERFGSAESIIRARYRDYIEDGLQLPPGDHENLEMAKVIIEIELFLRDISGKANATEVKGDARLNLLYEELCRYLGIESLEFSDVNGSRQILKQARSLFAYIARACTFANNSEIAGRLGGMDPSTVTKLCNSFADKMKKDQEGMQLREAVNTIISSFWTPDPGI